MGAIEQLNFRPREGGIFQKFSKNSNDRRVVRGYVEASIWLVQLLKYFPETLLMLLRKKMQKSPFIINSLKYKQEVLLKSTCTLDWLSLGQRLHCWFCGVTKKKKKPIDYLVILAMFCEDFSFYKTYYYSETYRVFIRVYLAQKRIEINREIGTKPPCSIAFCLHNIFQDGRMDNKFELHHGMYNLEWYFHGIADTGSLSKCVSFSLHLKHDRRMHFTHFCQSISRERILTFFLLFLKE